MTLVYRYILGILAVLGYLAVGWLLAKGGALLAPSADIGIFVVAVGVLGAPFAVAYFWPRIEGFLNQTTTRR